MCRTVGLPEKRVGNYIEFCAVNGTITFLHFPAYFLYKISWYPGNVGGLGVGYSHRDRFFQPALP